MTRRQTLHDMVERIRSSPGAYQAFADWTALPLLAECEEVWEAYQDALKLIRNTLVVPEGEHTVSVLHTSGRYCEPQCVVCGRVRRDDDRESPPGVVHYDDCELDRVLAKAAAFGKEAEHG